MKKHEINPKLLEYMDIVKSLGTILGHDCEILLHDASRPESSVIACENTHVSGRALGSPMTDFGLRILKDSNYRSMTGVYNYLATSEDGKILKCGVHFIKDSRGKIIGFLCVNMDTTKARAAQEMLNELFRVESSLPVPADTYKERFSKDLDDVVLSSISSVKSKLGKNLSELSREENLDVVRELDKCGYFLVKGAMDKLSVEMKKSKFTLYAYLREIRNTGTEEYPKSCDEARVSSDKRKRRQKKRGTL